jgi:hypothetical protein
MVKVLTAGKSSIPIGPVYFTRDYVRRGFLSNKKYMQGARGVVLRVHTLLGRPTHVTCAYRTVSSYLKCPLITSEPSIDV